MGSRHSAPFEFWKEFSIQLPFCLWKSSFTNPLVTNDSKVQGMTLPLWETEEGSCLLKEDLWDCCCRCDCDEETTLYRKEILKKHTLLGGVDGSPETTTTRRKHGQKYSFADRYSCLPEAQPVFYQTAWISLYLHCWELQNHRLGD